MRRHRRRQARRDQQLDVRRVAEDVGAEREQDARDDRGSARPDQLAREQIHRDEGERERDQDDGVVRRVRVVRRDPHRHAERAGADVGLGVGERLFLGIEDVGVEEVSGRGGQRVADPRDDPDAEKAVALIGSAAVRQPRRQRPRHHDGEDDGERGDAYGLSPDEGNHRLHRLHRFFFGGVTLSGATEVAPYDRGESSENM